MRLNRLVALLALASLLCLGCSSSRGTTTGDTTTQDTGAPDSTSSDTPGSDAAADVATLNCKAPLAVPDPENRGIVIAEVQPQEYVELYNPTDAKQVITDLFLCFGADCTKLLYLTNDPAFEILPGRFKVAKWPGNNAKGTKDKGEVTLSSDSNPTADNYAHTIDYVCWGAADAGPPQHPWYMDDLSDNTKKWDKTKGCAPALTGTADNEVITRKDNVLGNEPAHYLTDGAPTRDPDGCATRPLPPKVVNLPGGGTLSIPFDALPNGTTVEVKSVANPTDDSFTAVGPFFEFTPAGLTFAEPITVVIPYGGATIPNGFSEDDLAIFWTNAEGKYERLTVAIDKDQKTLTATVNHFSTAGVGAAKVTCCKSPDGQLWEHTGDPCFSDQSVAKNGQCGQVCCVHVSDGATEITNYSDCAPFTMSRSSRSLAECELVCCERNGGFSSKPQSWCTENGGKVATDSGKCVDDCLSKTDPIEQFCCYHVKICPLDTVESCKKSYTAHDPDKLACVKKNVAEETKTCICL